MSNNIYAILMSAVLLGAGEVSAETVSQKQASRVASLFSNTVSGQVMAAPQLAWNGKKLTTDKLFTPFYVYNMGGGGFVIVSAENKAYPILGYSLKGKFDGDRLSDTQKEWLRQYARDIENIRYDSRVPDEAIAAWGDLPGYIASVVNAPSQVSDYLFSPDEARQRLSNVEGSADADLTESEIYTPGQWRDMVEDEMRQRGNVTAGLIKNGDYIPVAIHGGKGDYFAIATDTGGSDDGVWMMRLNATEYLSGGMVADIGNPIIIEVAEEEDIPFEWQDEFLAEVESAPARRLAQYDMTLFPDRPVVTGLGGGHFAVSFPEEIRVANIYNVAGSMIGQQKYSESDTANFDLSAQPGGFYLIMVEGVSGHPYGLKLYR